MLFKILLLVYKALHANVPPYISDLLIPKRIDCNSLRSNDLLMRVPKRMRKTFGDRAFAKAGPFSWWNELPVDICGASTVEASKSRLKVAQYSF